MNEPITVNVTQEHIDKGVPKTLANLDDRDVQCMVELALADHFQMPARIGLTYLKVGSRFGHVADEDCWLVEKAITNFDRGLLVEPFSFEVVLDG